MTAILRPFFLTPARGADTAIYLASSPEVEGRTGEYYVRRHPRRPSAEAGDPQVARRLWDESARLVGLD